MDLKTMALGAGIVAVGESVTYGIWNYFPRNTEYEELARPIVTLAVGLVAAVAGGKLIKRGFDETPINNPPNPRTPARNPNLQAYPQIARTEEDELEEIYHPDTGRVIGRRARRYRQNP